MLSLGGLVGFWLTYRAVERAPREAGATFTLAVLAFAAGLLGARGLSFILHRPLYRDQPWWSVFAVWDRGGMALYGGLALAAAVGLVYIRLKGLPAWNAADTLVGAWVPFLFFVRIGCFLNGCCYGRPTTSPLGVVAGGAPNNVNFGIPSHPTQLYDAGAMLGIFALLWWMRGRRSYAGQLTVAFLALHSAFRLVHEPLRGDPRIAWSVGTLGVLSLNQLIGLALLAFAVAAGAILRRRGPAPTGAAG